MERKFIRAETLSSFLPIQNESISAQNIADRASKDVSSEVVWTADDPIKYRLAIRHLWSRWVDHSRTLWNHRVNAGLLLKVVDDR